ncbi:hypothetical protein ACFJIS_13725 [Variovorax boronicumulans]|uniref:hypothetical protein n=1 Tax=Variovorax boronicumulans TaxID=436515 RepID=UPI0036F44CA1
MIRVATALVSLAAIAGCAGKLDYVRPTTPTSVENTKVINKSRQAVWDAAVPQLGKEFFVINNLDKSSGLINISYSGDPEKYVDCGRIVSYVKNARGERTYDFPAARQQMDYEIMTSNLFFLSRQMNLDGRVNLIFEEIGPEQTRVSANTRYALRLEQTTRDVHGRSVNNGATNVAFNTNTSASFPRADNSNEPVSCRSTGQLEKDLLSNIR